MLRNGEKVVSAIVASLESASLSCPHCRYTRKSSKVEVRVPGTVDFDTEKSLIDFSRSEGDRVMSPLGETNQNLALWSRILDPSTALKPRSGERGKKNRSGSTLSMPRAGARGRRRVD